MNSSTIAENNPYSTNPHLIFEFKIPKSIFKSSSSTFGFLVFIICDSENLNAEFPSVDEFDKPDNWADLIFFDETIQIFGDVQTAINLANNAIISAKVDGRTDDLKQAETLIDQAEYAREEHNYKEAIDFANQAKESAEFASIPNKSNSDETPSFELFILIFAIAIFLFIKLRSIQ